MDRCLGGVTPAVRGLFHKRIRYPFGVLLRADSARVRTRMLAAARARVEAGDLELPMNAVAREAGVGVGTMYRHFAGRQALLEALAADSFRQLIEQAVAAAREPDIAMGLAALLRAALDRQVADRALAAVLASPMFETAGTPTFESAQTSELLGELMAAAQRVLDRARAEGVLRPDVTPDDMRRLTCGVQHAVRSGDDREAAVDRYLEILLQGLRPQKRAGSR